MSEFHKFDVTDRILAKLQADFMELYIGKECIGKLVINSDGKQYELVSGYLYEEERVFRLYERCTEQIQYAEGCDLGWC
ncbi:DUF2553 family protein [Metabacillus herbersteinensis]|uniref:DUF2553 family protein n=1 Tax=Metabacillus herbersteinensis TaxID=283816 RepID=A0ABV6GLE1_9BACI